MEVDPFSEQYSRRPPNKTETLQKLSPRMTDGSKNMNNQKPKEQEKVTSFKIKEEEGDVGPVSVNKKKPDNGSAPNTAKIPDISPAVTAKKSNNGSAPVNEKKEKDVILSHINDNRDTIPQKLHYPSMPRKELGREGLKRLCDIVKRMKEHQEILINLDNDRGEKRMNTILLLYSLYEEAASLCHGSIKLKQILMIGQQSSGKTSLLEALLGLPLGTPKREMATKIPLLIRMRRDESATIPMITLIHQGVTTFCKDPQELIDKIVEKNNSVKVMDPNVYLEIIIEYSKCRTMTLIDLPGLFISETANCDFAPKDVENLVEKWLKDRPNDRIILVQRLIDDKATTIAMDFLQRFDPNYERTIVVQTHMDTVNNDVELVMSNNIKYLSDGKYIVPYFLSLHNFPTENRDGAISRVSPWQDQRDAIEEAKLVNRQQDRNKVAYFSDKGKEFFKDHVGLDAFEKRFHIEINKDFLSNTKEIEQLLSTELQRVGQEHSVFYKNFENMRDPHHEVASFINNFVDQMRIIFSGNAHDEDVIQMFGKSATEEVKDAERFMQTIINPVAPWPPAWNENWMHIENAENRLFTKMFFQRALTDVKRRLLSIKTTSLTEDQILNAIGMVSDKMALEMSIEPLLRYIAEKQLANGVNYCVWRAAFVIHNLKDVAFHYLKPSYGALLSTPSFVDQFNKVFSQYLNEKAEMSIARCKQYIKDKTSHLRWNLPNELAGEIVPDDGNDKLYKENQSKQYSYNNIRSVLQNHIPKDKITQELLDDLYHVVSRGNAISPILKKFTGEFNTSIKVTPEKMEAIREYIEEQFSTLKHLIILDLLSTIDTNITGEFDTKNVEDKILFKHLSNHLKPDELKLDDMKNSLEQKLTEYQTEKEQLQELVRLSADIAEAIESEVVPVSFRY